MEISGPVGFGERANMEQAGMLQNGMPMHMQPPATMQRPQSGNLQQQMYAKILTDLRSDMGRFAGSWQATFDPRERANLIMQMITALRMLERDMAKCMQTAQRFEATSITSAQNKRQYEKSMQDKLEAIKLKRQQNAQVGAFNGNFNANNMSIPAGMGMAAMQNASFGAAPSNQLQQTPQMNGFPAHAHLSRPLQPSQLNAVQQNSVDPSMLSNTPQLANNFAQQVNQAQNDLGMQQLQQGELPAELQAIAQRMMAALPEVKKVELRNQLLSQMSEQQRQNVNQRQIDPLRNWIVSKARQEYLKRNAMGANALANQQQQQQNAIQQLQNQAQQQQNQGLSDNLANQNFMASMNQQMGNVPQNAGDFDLSQLLGQQQSALKLQESGEQVVPISNNNAGMQYMNMIKNIGNQGAPGMMPQLSNGQMGQLNNQGTQLQAQALLQQQHARQKQMQEQLIAQRNLQANIRAMNQRNAGQNLNVPTAFTAPPAGSPAMSMLNRPVQQQQGNQQAKTPIQNQPRQPQQQNDMNALNMNQQMLGQQNMNAQAEAIKGAPQPVLALLNSLDPSVRNKILAMNPSDRNRALAQLKQMQDRKQQQLNQEFAGVQNTMNTQVDPSLLMRHSPPPGQQNTQTDEAIQAQQRQKQALRVHAMLSRPLPPNIANQLGIQIPPNVQFWHQLRAHIQQNRAVFPAEMPQMLMTTMDRHFSSNPAELQQAIGELIARQKQNLTAQQAAAGVANAQARAQAIQNTPAPSAQMQMPAAQIQALQQLAANGNMPQVTPQDIARFRITHKVDAKVSDDMLRNALMAQKIKELRSRQQAALAQQQNAAQNAAVTTQGQPIAAQGGILGQTGAGRQPAPSQAPIKPPQPPVRRQLQKTVSDDVMEIANPNLAKTANAQQQIKLQQQMASFGQPQQNKAAPKPPVPTGNAADQAKTLQQQEARAIVYKLYQELGPAPPKGNAIKVQPEEVNEVRKLFQRMWRPVGLLDSTLATSLQVIPGFTEQNAKDLLRAKQILMQNMLDEQGNIRDYLSRNFHDLKTISDNILRYYNNLQAVSKNNAARAGQMSQPGQPPAAPAVPAPAQPAGRPQAVPARKASNSGKPPAAPTDDDKKFWGVASPHGVPKYETSKPELTADQLKFPPQKRRKVLAGQSGSQPTSQPTTPAQANLAKPATPTVAKQAEVQKPQPEKVRLRCKSDICEFSITGFETEQQLKEHIETAHKPIENPLQFLFESMVEPAKAGPRSAVKAADKPVKVPTPEKTLEDHMLEKYGFGDLVNQASAEADPDFHPEIFDEVGDVIMSGLQDLDPFNFDESAKIDWGLGLDDIASIGDTTSPELTPDSQGSIATSDISLNDRLKINLEWDAFGSGGMLPDSMVVDEPLVAKQDQGIDADNKDDWNWDTDLMNWDFSTAKPTE